MINKHKKIRHFTLLIVKAMQSKTTMRYQLTVVRMALIKCLQITNASEGVEKMKSHTLLVGTDAATVEEVWRILKKLKSCNMN